MQRLLDRIFVYSQNQNYPYKGYAIFQLISNVIFYSIWNYFQQHSYENLFIRITLSVLCIPLLFIEQWPKKIIKFLPLYWYFTLVYSLVFFFIFMLLKNELNYMWSLNALSGIVLWILILDYKSLLYLTPLGIIAAYLVFYITSSNTYIPIDNLKVVIVTYVSVLIFGYIFSHRSNKFHNQKLNDLSSQSGAIAHEMRTPLANILMGSAFVKTISDRIEKLTTLLPEVQGMMLKDEIAELRDISHRFTRIAKGSQNLINLLLTNLKQDLDNFVHTPLSIAYCLEHVYEEFAFKPHEQSKVHINIVSDFTFQGNLELVTHVFFNLLKNSLYFIHAAGKGEIFITIDQTELDNVIVFKDNGPGITASQLPHLFKPFYSQRPHGTGIGLSFCKKAIENMNGKIEVNSVLGEYTIFIIRLPKIKNLLIE